MSDQVNLKKVVFVWPQEPWKPTSLFKHIVYLGETAGYISRYADVEVYDFSVTQMLKRDMYEILRKADYLFIPIEAYTAVAAVRLAHLAKTTEKTYVVAYGTVAAMNPKLLSYYFDAVIATGHWYNALKELILDQEAFTRKLQGNIYYLAKHMEDRWAYPLFDKMPLDEYQKIMNGQLDIGIQIGCVFNCSFCAEKRMIPENKIYHRSPQDIYEFVRDNPSPIYYLDATTFSYDKEWAYEVCDLLSTINPLPKWRTVTRVDMIDRDMIRAMKKAGCFKIGFGIETLAPSLQKSINKLFNEKKLIENLQMVKEEGIIPRCFLILGIPGQTAEEVRYTNDIMKNLGMEYRWKEYVPFEIIPTFKDIREFEMFERNSYFMHDVKGLSKEEYIDLLAVSR